MARRGRFMAGSQARALLMLMLASAATACAQPRADVAGATSMCNLNVIVALDTAPDAVSLADLSRVSGARVELIRAMTSNLYLLALEAQGDDSECKAALERLRGDPRVRSADVDARRKIQ